jgi:DNA-binding CsgD family transcriptional regulator
MSALSRSDFPVLNVMVPSALSFMIRWGECLHGEGSLREALLEFAELAAADVVLLQRLNSATGSQRTIATVDRSSMRGARPLTRAHGLALVGATSSRAKPGSLWSMAELDRDATDRLDARVLGWMKDRSLHEAMLIPLSAEGDQHDVLEFYSSAPLDHLRYLAIEMVASATAEAWRRRPRGRIAQILRAAPAMNDRSQSICAAAHPLSESNPLGFTAAELRIADMIQRGASLRDLSGTLGIADSTLRSHLRSIYTKAGVAGHVGLVRLLLAPHNAQSALRA